jgi:hypothetical protein
MFAVLTGWMLGAKATRELRHATHSAGEGREASEKVRSRQAKKAVTSHAVSEGATLRYVREKMEAGCAPARDAGDEHG